MAFSLPTALFFFKQAVEYHALEIEMFQLGNVLSYKNKTNIVGFQPFDLDYILLKCRPSLTFCLLGINRKIKGSDYLMLASLL